MKPILILLFFLMCGMSASAQYTFVKQWDKRFGGDSSDLLKKIVPTGDGYFLAGFSSSGISGDKTQTIWGGYDYWLVKIDGLGNKQWDIRYGGQGGDFLYCSTKAADGNYILGGMSGSSANGDKSEFSRGGLDYWIVKVDGNGNKLWDRCFGAAKGENMYTLKQTKDEGFILGGYSNSSIGGDKTENGRDSTHLTDDFWVVKTDALGSKQWDRTFGGMSEEGLGTICLHQDGGYLLGGSSGSDAGGDKSENNRDSTGNTFDYWIIKIDSAGNKQWDKTYGSDRNDFLQTILPVANGHYILAGHSLGGISGNKSIAKDGYWLITIDSVGNKLREWAYYGGASLQGVALTSDGGYILSGHGGNGTPGPDNDKTEYNTISGYQTWVIKIDSIGQKQWDKTLFTAAPGDNGGYPLQTVDGCYIVGTNAYGNIGGYKTQNNWNNSGDYWVIKFCMEPFNSIDDRQPTTGNNQLLVYPNPFTSDVSIAFTGQHVSAATYTITNLTGQTVYHQTESNLASGYTKMLDLSYLPSGVYFVEVSTSEGKMVERVVKE